MAGGAYLSAKKGTMEFAVKAAERSLGVVDVMLGGPRRVELVVVQTSRRPQALSTSSRRVRVLSSVLS